MIVFYAFMAYTEITGKWVTTFPASALDTSEPETVIEADTQQLPQPESGQEDSNG